MNSFFKSRFAVLMAVGIAVFIALTVVAFVLGGRMLDFDFSGVGTADDPYLISSDADFKRLVLNSSDGNYTETVGKHFRLTRDVNAYEQGVDTDKYGFMGYLDGDGHTVTVHGAVFNKLAKATVTNVKFVIRYDEHEVDNGDVYRPRIAHYVTDTVFDGVEFSYDVRLANDARIVTGGKGVTYAPTAGSAKKSEFRNCKFDIRFDGAASAAIGGRYYFSPIHGLDLADCTVTTYTELAPGETGLTSLEVNYADASAKNTVFTHSLVMRDRLDDGVERDYYNTFLADKSIPGDIGTVVTKVTRNLETVVNMDISAAENCRFAVDIDYTFAQNAVLGYRNLNINLPKTDCEKTLDLDYSALDTVKKDDCVFAERDGVLYFIDYVGGGDTALLPEIADGEYKGYVLNNLSLIRGELRNVALPESLTGYSSSVLGWEIETISYAGKMQSFRSIRAANTGVSWGLGTRKVVCTDGAL